MIKNRLGISIIICACCLLSASHRQDDSISVKDVEKSLIQLNEKLYVSKYEVSNLEYRIFLSYLKSAQKSHDYEIAIYDSLKWQDALSLNESYVKSYHSHPAYNLYPAVNITYEGATMFCEWLSNTYNSNSKRKFSKVRFKLPSEAEWKFAARGDNENQIFPWIGVHMTETNGQFRANFTRVLQSHISTDISSGLPIVKLRINNDLYEKGYDRMSWSSICAPVHSFEQKKNGICNISGNVAEMLIEKGKTKGGSWASYGYYLRIDAEDEFEKAPAAAAMIGFRYFMEIIEN